MHKMTLKWQFLIVLLTVWVGKSPGALAPDEIKRMKVLVSQRRDVLANKDLDLRKQWALEHRDAMAAIRRAVAEEAYEVLEAAFQGNDVDVRDLAVDNLEKVPLEERKRIMLAALTDGDWPDPEEIWQGGITGVRQGTQSTFCLRLSEVLGVKVGNKKLDQHITDPLWSKAERLAVAAMLREKMGLPPLAVPAPPPQAPGAPRSATNPGGNREIPPAGVTRPASESGETPSPKAPKTLAIVGGLLVVGFASWLGYRMVRRKQP